MTLPFPDNPYGFSTNVNTAQCQFTAAAACGMSWVRRVISWSNLEPTEGNFDAPTLAQLDSEVQAAYTAGLNFTFVVSNAPAWANSVFHNGCSNINDQKELALAQTLLNRYNGGIVPNAIIARWETGNEGYDDTGGACDTFENAVPVLQAVYPWIKSNYPNVLVGTPAHFNLGQTHIQTVQTSLYNGFYGNAAGLFDYSNYHFYGIVRNNGVYTGPDGTQGAGNDTFNQEWQDIHNVDLSFNNNVPVYCTETGVSIPGTSGQNTELDHASYFVGGQGTTGVFQDGANASGILTHVGAWTFQNSNQYSFVSGCAVMTFKPVYYYVQQFIKTYPQWPVNTGTSKMALFALKGLI